MPNRIFTFCMSLLFLALGICVLIPALLSPPPPQLIHQQTIFFHFGYLFSFLPMNLISAIIFLAAGVGGLLAAVSTRTSRAYEKIICIGSTALFLLGLLPFGTSRLWGLLPLYSWTDLIFFLIAVMSFYFAFVDGPNPRLNEPI